MRASLSTALEICSAVACAVPSAAAIEMMARIDPELPSATRGKPAIPRGRFSSTASRAYSRNRRSCLGEMSRLLLNISVSRTDPMATLHNFDGSPPTAAATSVEPPPMSMQRARAAGGLPDKTPRHIRRASSLPEIASRTTPASRLARPMISSRFLASRSELVPTARTCALCRLQMMA